MILQARSEQKKAAKAASLGKEKSRKADLCCSQVLDLRDFVAYNIAHKQRSFKKERKKESAQREWVSKADERCRGGRKGAQRISTHPPIAI